MAKKAKVVEAKPTDFHTGLTGDDIPDFLLVKNRKPLTAEQQAKLDTQTIKQQPERHDGRKPKGMSWEDWDALQVAETSRKQAVNGKVQEERKPNGERAKARKAEGMLDAHHFAPLCGCPAKVVRRALRDKKQTTIKKPSIGWVFPKEDEAKVVAVVKQYLTSKGLKGSEPKPRKAKAAPGSERAALKQQPASDTSKPEAKPDAVTAKAVEKMLAKLPAKKTKKQ